MGNGLVVLEFYLMFFLLPFLLHAEAIASIIARYHFYTFM
jgi:hypothetical protein